jgi:hypothetical protein
MDTSWSRLVSITRDAALMDGHDPGSGLDQPGGLAAEADAALMDGHWAEP